MAPRPLPLLAALTMLFFSGLVQGSLTQRWQPSAALDDACIRLAKLPLNVGPWKGSELAVDPAPYQQARAAGFWVRQYVKVGTKGSINVILMCGRPGHMSVHTPDICYPGAGYTLLGQQVKQAIPIDGPTPPAELWTAQFRHASKSGRLVIYWTWSANGIWQVPASPRWTFGGEPFLYKLYVVRQSAEESRDDQFTVDFLRQLLGELNRGLFSTEPQEVQSKSID